jgi:hypothetical protein
MFAKLTIIMYLIVTPIGTTVPEKSIKVFDSIIECIQERDIINNSNIPGTDLYESVCITGFDHQAILQNWNVKNKALYHMAKK